MSDQNIPSKNDLANHVRVYTGRLFYDGSYTDEQRWVKAEFFEALRDRLASETSGDWQPIETFDFVQGFAATRWVLVHTSDGRVTEGLPFIFDGDKRGWMCACGNNAHDPRYIPSPSLLRDTVTHWMPKPAPPQVKAEVPPVTSDTRPCAVDGCPNDATWGYRRCVPHMRQLDAEKTSASPDDPHSDLPVELNP